MHIFFHVIKKDQQGSKSRNKKTWRFKVFGKKKIKDVFEKVFYLISTFKAELPNKC